MTLVTYCEIIDKSDKINQQKMPGSTAKIILILIIMMFLSSVEVYYRYIDQTKDLQTTRAMTDTDVDHEKETNLTTASAS